jgi:hypothetical protein
VWFTHTQTQFEAKEEESNVQVDRCSEVFSRFSTNGSVLALKRLLTFMFVDGVVILNLSGGNI